MSESFGMRPTKMRHREAQERRLPAEPDESDLAKTEMPPEAPVEATPEAPELEAEEGSPVLVDLHEETVPEGVEVLEDPPEDLLDASEEFLSLIRPCAPCKKFARLGEGYDGGYIMCTDGLDETLEGAFSFGIYGFDGWGMEVSKLYKVPVHEYDCFDTNAPKSCEGCDAHFHPRCIGAASLTPNETWTTFSEELRRHSLGSKDRSLLLKMDIEGSEIDLLTEEPVENLRKARQVVVELHGISQPEVRRFLAVARKMKEAGFVVAHLHGNNCCPAATFGEFSVPSYLEVTYVLAPSEGCSSGLPLHLSLDHRVLDNETEVADPILPST